MDKQTEMAFGYALGGLAEDVDPVNIPEVSLKDAATFVAEMTPIVGDVMAAKEVYDELQKDEPNYYLAGALGGAALIGLIPGVGDIAAKAIKKGAKEVFDVAKRVEVDTNAMGSGLGNVKLKPKEPKTTIKAYKLFRTDPKQPSKLFPLFVDAKTPVETGTWVNAKAGDLGGKGKVKSKIGPLAYRPGWHAGDLPIATHIGGKVDPKTGKRVVDRKFQPNVREENQVWAEVEMADDVDWQSVANSRAVMTKAGKPNPRTAHITDQLPSGGNYRYKTNSNMTGEWIIGGEMKVNRVLSRDEVNAINEAAGVKDLPTLKELNKSYSKGGVVMDDYQYAELNKGSEDQTVQAFALGGLAEDVDPVSGNEVPVGSMPEEVRDDIPAQLSEGEYVVPADVVRFFGVKFFEDIRAEAKQGFAQMESNGRVGGEPMGMEVINPEDDIEFDESDFDIIDGPDGYAEGGDVSSTDAMAVLSGSGPKTMEMREFVNAAGNTITIMYFNGMPMSVIPEGYTEVAPEPVTSPGAPVTSTEVVNNSDDDSGVDLPENKPVNYKELSASELQAMVKDSKGMANSIIGGGALMINPIIGLAVKAAMWHQRKQVEKELVRRVEDDTIDPAIRTQYEELLQIAEEDTPGMWTRLFGTDRDKEKAGLGDFPFDPVSAEPEAIDDAVKEAMEYTPEDTTTITKDPLYRSPITGWQSAETNAEIAEVAAANAAISQAYVPEADARFEGVPTPGGVPDSPRLSELTKPTSLMMTREERIADAKRRDIAEKKAELRKRAQQAQADINAQQSNKDNSPPKTSTKTSSANAAAAKSMMSAGVSSLSGSKSKGAKKLSSGKYSGSGR